MTARALQHQSHFTWQSRCAPRSTGDELPGKWRERAAQHRALCPVLQGQRPPKPQHVAYAKAAAPDAELKSLNHVAEVQGVAIAERAEGEELDGDWGALSRVEISRYISRRSAGLALSAESSRQRRAAAAAREWTEVPGAHADVIEGLEDAEAWKVALEAIAFERTHLRRGTSNSWPDALWSPSCLSPEAAEDLEAKICGFLTLEAGRLSQCKALPVAVLLRHLQCDCRAARGDLRGAAEALAGAVAQETGADPLRPPLLFGWEDSLSCDYLKAQHCARLARLAFLAAEAARETAEADPNLKLRRASQLDQANKALVAARRLLKDAVRLYEAEISANQRLQLLDKEEEWWLALHCSQVLTLQLQAAVHKLLDSPAEAKKVLSRAIQQTVAVQASPSATPRLQRLLRTLRTRLMEEAGESNGLDVLPGQPQPE